MCSSPKSSDELIPGLRRSMIISFKAEDRHPDCTRFSTISEVAFCHHLSTALEARLPRVKRSCNQFMILRLGLRIPNSAFRNDIGICLQTEGSSWSIRVNINCSDWQKIINTLQTNTARSASRWHWFFHPQQWAVSLQCCLPSKALKTSAEPLIQCTTSWKSS